MSEPFCAHCIDGTEGLELVDYDERRVLMCLECREGDVRGGNYSFGGERERGNYGLGPGNRSNGKAPGRRSR